MRSVFLEKRPFSVDSTVAACGICRDVLRRFHIYARSIDCWPNLCCVEVDFAYCFCLWRSKRQTLSCNFAHEMFLVLRGRYFWFQDICMFYIWNIYNWYLVFISDAQNLTTKIPTKSYRRHRPETPVNLPSFRHLFVAFSVDFVRSSSSVGRIVVSAATGFFLMMIIDEAETHILPVYLRQHLQRVSPQFGGAPLRIKGAAAPPWRFA